MEMALQLDSSPSIITIYTKYLLAQIYDEQDKLDNSEQTCQIACELRSTYFPYSLLYATCLSDLGLQYRHMKNLSKRRSNSL